MVPHQFLNLPLKIRLLIYKHLILTRNTARAAAFDKTLHHSAYLIVLPLFLLCRQVLHKARYTFYQENNFVPIVTNYEYLACDLDVAGTSTLASGRVAKKFPCYGLRLSITFAQAGSVWQVKVALEYIQSICHVLPSMPAFPLLAPVIINMMIFEPMPAAYRSYFQHFELSRLIQNSFRPMATRTQDGGYKATSAFLEVYRMRKALERRQHTHAKLSASRREVANQCQLCRNLPGARAVGRWHTTRHSLPWTCWRNLG